jgi:alpha-acetolactate decarboxylase
MRLFWLSAVTLCAIGCTSSETPQKLSETPAWDGTVQQWGTLREVMHGEVMDGQVRLSEVTDKPHVVGIGAPDKLQGEILIADSVAWLAQVRDGDRIETRKGSPKDSAVFLAISRVPRWTDMKVEQDVPADEFDDFIQKTLDQAGLTKLETVPFVIEGEFPALNLHILNGQCPFAEVKADIEGAGPPHRKTLTDVQGLLVGFYAENGAGQITHHWTRTHVHALVGAQDSRVAGHVDEVALKAGTTIRLPVYSTNHRE